MYQKSAQRLSTDECYPERVIEEFNLIPYYKLTLLVVNSFSGDTEKLYPQIYKLFSQAKIIKVSVMTVA